MSRCNINVLASSAVYQVSAMVAVLTSQLQAGNMCGQLTCLQRQHHITSLLMHMTLELDFGWEGHLLYL